MNIQETNNIPKFKRNIKVDSSEERLCSKEPGDQITSSIFHDTGIQGESQSLIHEKADIEIEDDDHEIIIFHHTGIQNEHFNESQSLIHDVADVEIEDQEDDSDIIEVNDMEIKWEIQDEYLDEPEFVINKNIEIETGEEDRSKSIYEVNTTDSKKQKYPCILCDKSYYQKRSIDAHYVATHPNRFDVWRDKLTFKINECPNCDYKTVLPSVFRKHLTIHDDPIYQLKWKCNICGFQCSRRSYVSHMLLHSTDQSPYVCTECNMSYNQKVQLDGHIVARHSNNKRLINSVTHEVYRCDTCDYKTVKKRRIRPHMMGCKLNSPAGKSKFSCKHRHSKCLSSTSLTEHLPDYVDQPSYACKECGKSHTNKRNLDGHIVAQHSENEELMNSVTTPVHQCTSCDFKTINTSRIKKHMTWCKYKRTPENDFMFKCIDCEFKCFSKTELKRHVSLHAVPLPPFACTKCDISFHKKEQLAAHIEDTHPNSQNLRKEPNDDQSFHITFKKYVGESDL